MTIGRTLFIQLKMLGDILMLTPAIKAFKKKYPDTVLDVAVQAPGDQLLKFNPYVDNTILVGKPDWYAIFSQASFIKRLRGNSYDLALDFLGNPRSAHYTFLSGADRRIGYDDARFKYAYNKTYERIHGYSAISKLKFLDFLNINTEDYRPEFHLDPEAKLPPGLDNISRENWLAISPVSLRPHKVWPTKRFARLLDHLKQTYRHEALVIVGPGEQRFLDEFKRCAGSGYTGLYIDNLMQLGKVLGKCKLFIGNDNGPKHIAVAMKVPTFTIYSTQVDPVCWEYPDQTWHRYAGGFNTPEAMPINELSFDRIKRGVSSMIDDLGIFQKI